jgi:CRP/FNR family cyclic AMP-dependent transcriptional regulator
MANAPGLQRRLTEFGRQPFFTRRRTARDRNGHLAAIDLSQKIGYLSEARVFAQLPQSEHVWLANNTTMLACEGGRIFYEPDDTAEVVFILKRGRVNLYRLSPEGRKLIVATLGPRLIFGEMALIGQGMYGCFAEAAEDSLLCVLSRADLQALIRRNPDVALNLLEELGERLRAHEADLESLAFRALPARLAALLLHESDPYGAIDGLSHQDLADRLGTYRETVSQLLGRFRSERLIATEPRHIKLIDSDGLRAYAEA